MLLGTRISKYFLYIMYTYCCVFHKNVALFFLCVNVYYALYAQKHELYIMSILSCAREMGSPAEPLTPYGPDNQML